DFARNGPQAALDQAHGGAVIGAGTAGRLVHILGDLQSGVFLQGHNGRVDEAQLGEAGGAGGDDVADEETVATHQQPHAVVGDGGDIANGVNHVACGLFFGSMQ